MESLEINDAIEYNADEKLILRWDSPASIEAREPTLFDEYRQEADQYLYAIDKIQMKSVSISSDHNKIKSSTQIPIGRLKNEFRNILIAYAHTQTNPIETNAFIDSNSSTTIAESSGDFKPSRLEDEFHNILITRTNPIETEPNSPTSWSSVTETTADFKTAHESTIEGYLEDEVTRSTTSYRSAITMHDIDLIPLEVIYDLRSIIGTMIASGYQRECIQVYVSVHKPMVESSINRLGIEKLSIRDALRLEWDAFETRIRRCILAAKVSIQVVFASEKRLCEQIFEGEGLGAETTDACFLETVKGPVIQLFNFIEALSISRRPPEKLFKILDLHDALSDLLPEVDVLFGSKSLEHVRVQAAELLSSLAETSREMLLEFSNMVLRYRSKSPAPGGRIHPLTKYVMNFVILVSDYKQTLMDLFRSEPSMGSLILGDQTDPDINHHSPLALHLLLIIEFLQSKLEIKSKYYKDASLSHIFLMNNIHYIVQKVKESPKLHKMIEDNNFMRKSTQRVREESKSYENFAWVGILNFLREGLHVRRCFSSGVSKSLLKERFKRFNSMFEEVHRVQATWLVANPHLREELQISISEKLIPTYRSFLGQFKVHIESWKHPEMYIKYSVEDLEIAILDFFEGHTASHHTRFKLI